MKNKLLNILLSSVFVLFFSSANSQNIFTETFDNGNPFNNANITTGYPLSTGNCTDTTYTDPSYTIGNNFNSGCILFPNVPATGNCMTTDEDDSNPNSRLLYQRANLNLTAGLYQLNLISTTRTCSGNPAFTGNPTILNIEINNQVVGTIQLSFQQTSFLGSNVQINIPTNATVFGLRVSNPAFCGDFAVDNITLTKICGSPPTAGFILVDEANQQSNLFCVGEPVSFVNTNTNNETEWFIQICQREIGAAAGSDCINWKSNRPFPGGWNQGQVPATVDLLSQVWATGNQSNWIFWGDYEYTVGLAVRDAPCVFWVDYNQTFIVEPCEVEIAHISQYPYSDDDSDDDCTFCFDASVSYSECVGDLLYHWNFGDGTTSNELSPCHTFSGNGNYNVTLYIEAYTNISTSLPCETATESIITCVHNCACECDVDNNGFGVIVGENDCMVTTYPIEPDTSLCTTVIYYKWIWDDGSFTVTTDLENVEHTYSANGTYEICLEIGALSEGNDQFCLDIICKTVEVYCTFPPDDGGGDDYLQKIFNDNKSALIEVTPNPTSGEILLSINKSWGKNVKLNIISITGQVLIESNLDAETDRNIKINLTDFDSGIYILHLENEFGKTEFTKIIKH